MRALSLKSRFNVRFHNSNVNDCCELESSFDLTLETRQSGMVSN